MKEKGKRDQRRTPGATIGLKECKLQRMQAKRQRTKEWRVGSRGKSGEHLIGEHEQVEVRVRHHDIPTHSCVMLRVG
jgi:hypothetical protein